MEKLVLQIILIFSCLSLWIKGDVTTVGVNRLDVEGLNKLIAEYDPHFVEPFNDKELFTTKWVTSKSKKEGVEGDLAKYDGNCVVDSPIKHALPDDYGLLLREKAKHYAISSLLNRPFEFIDKPFVLQYEVLFQDGLECGGGYVKMISGERSIMDLKNFHDKTSYTIMFGPDKCGSNRKIHFIFRHKNPLNGSFEEKHCNSISSKFEEIFTDGKPHLYTLIIHPDNTYKILIDHKVINEGSLLKDFVPPVNPPAEVDDPTDSKPTDWDDREKIPDPNSSKPDDWDEDAPHTIPDPAATKPDNWLDNEPLYIRDPSAEKPHDWDVEMDGEWEAPLVPNPACEDAGGCGEWTPPRINNPAYKGKWSPPLIDNPNYKGKWSPRKIPNAHFFEDKNPFKMEKIGAVGFEIWSMTPNILFDNILVTDSEELARKWSEITFNLKLQNIEQNAKTLKTRLMKLLNYKPGWWALYFTYCSIPVGLYIYYLKWRVQKESFFGSVISFTNRYPWLWALYTVVLLVVVTLIVYCCFWNIKDTYEHKKTDSPQSDIFDEMSSTNDVDATEAAVAGTNESDEENKVSNDGNAVKAENVEPNTNESEDIEKNCIDRSGAEGEDHQARHKVPSPYCFEKYNALEELAK